MKIPNISIINILYIGFDFVSINNIIEEVQTANNPPLDAKRIWAESETNITNTYMRFEITPLFFALNN